ncbi:MAG TPA: hypothetical protein VFA19_04390 [Gaiellaceae bacterium]|nr:hypothetical protein [Gaiellaceae bacterium]
MTPVDPVKLAEHFYETKRHLPTLVELRAYADEQDVPLPRCKISEVRSELVAQRAARGLQTPADGPAPGTELSPDELEQMLAGVTPRLRAGTWTHDCVIAALVEYLREYEQKVPLRQKHFLAVRRGHRWPTLDTITRVGKQSGIGGFQKMLDEARRRARAAAEESAQAA